MDFESARIQKAYEVVASGGVATNVADCDVRDIVLATTSVVGCTDHGGIGTAGGLRSVGDVRQSDQVVAGVPSDIGDVNVLAALTKVETILIQRRFPRGIKR